MEKRERIELHCHSEFGGMATMYPGELIRYLSDKGMPAFAITDESNIIAYPELDMVWNTGKYSARPIYGMEMIVEENQLRYTVSVLIKNEEGKRALYRMISQNASNEKVQTFALADLLNNREGLLIGSGTDKGKIYSLTLSNASDEKISRELTRYDYIEVLPYEEYKAANQRIIKLSIEAGVPVVAISDARYADKIGRKALIIMNHWNKEDEELPQNHFWTTDEMLEAFDYLPYEVAYDIVVSNTYLIVDKCESVSVCPRDKYYPVVADADKKLRELCMKALEQKYPERKAEALERLEWELEALAETKMEAYVLNIKKLLDLSQLKASEISQRGTAAGSIVSFLLGISEVDPIKYNLAAEMIFAFTKDREIDIDINVPVKRQLEVHRKLNSIEGIKKAIYGGTLQLVSHTLAAAMVERYEMDTENFFEEEIRNRLIWCISGNYLGRGKHPGGMIVIPDECEYENIMPIATISGGFETSYFDYHSIDRSFIRYDLLKHDTPELLIELSSRTGIPIEAVPVDSSEVLELFAADVNGKVVACADLPDFKTDYVRDMVALMRPGCFDDLVKIVALAHGTNVWDGVGEKLVKEGTIGIKEIIADRDDAFEFNLALGLDRKTAFEIAEAVRKGIVARGRNAKWQGWKKLLIEAGAPDWYIRSCEQIKYLFPRAHVISYMFMTMRLGWYKVHYPDTYASIMEEYEGIGL
ncbi:MAG: PHP domain-containing protein [Lachnospiraceae bacterium]|nr:PHP domain-containing protein [Candidatus Colinaster scatohippi]